MGLLPEVHCGKKHSKSKKSTTKFPLPLHNVSNDWKLTVAGTKYKNFGFMGTAWTLS